MKFALGIFTLIITAAYMPPTWTADDPLPSWNAATSKQSIMAFVQSVTDKNGKSYVAPKDRIATFDIDG